MPIPPLRKVRPASPARGHTTSRATEPVSVARHGPKPASEAHRATKARQPAEDFAFTQDPLSGRVTLHVGRDGAPCILEDGAAEVAGIAREPALRADTGAPVRGATRGVPGTWSRLEPNPAPLAASEPALIIAPVPNPEAVH